MQNDDRRDTRTRQHRRRDEALVPGLRDERDHRAGAAGRARRAQAGASPRALRDAADGPGQQPRLPQVRQDRRRGHRQLPPARRRAGLRHPGPPGPGLQHAQDPGRRPGQLRLGRRRRAGRLPLHRSPPRGPRRGDDGRPRQGHRRLRPQLRRDHHRADGPPHRLPEPARQRLDRHRRRHGHQHPAAQHAGGDRRRRVGDRADAAGAGRQPDLHP